MSVASIAQTPCSAVISPRGGVARMRERPDVLNPVVSVHVVLARTDPSTLSGSVARLVGLEAVQRG